jgi:hypothetical protein
MAKNIGGIVNVAVDTFLTWVNRTNDVVTFIQTEAVSANSTGALTTGNGFVNGHFGANSLYLTNLVGGNLTVASAITIGSNLISNNSQQWFLGNSTVNAVVNSTILTLANSTVRANLTLGQLTIGIGKVNSTALGVGAKAFVNSSHIFVGNSTVNTVANSSQLDTGTANFTTGANVGANVNLTTSTFNIGNTTVNTFANSSYLRSGDGIFSGNVGVKTTTPDTDFQVNGHANVIGNLYVGGNFTIIGALQAAGNTEATGNFVPTANGFLLGNTTNRWTLFASNGTFSGNVTANIVSANIFNGAAAVNVGANVHLTTSALDIGNTTVNTQVNSSFATITGGNFRTSLYIGNSTVNSSINSTAITTNLLSAANLALTTFLSIGNSTVNTSANATTIILRGTVRMDSVTLETSGTSAQLFDTFDITAYRAADYIAAIKDNSANGYQMTKFGILHFGDGVHITEYATMTSNASIGTFTANSNTTFIRVYYTPVSTNTTVKANRHLIGI